MDRDAGERVVIRPYRRGDYDRVAALWRELGIHEGAWDRPEALDYKAEHDRGPFLVAEAEDRIVGTAMGSWDGRWAWVSRLAVAPAVQRRGIGSLLMKEVERRLGELGADRFFLATLHDNVAARALYERLGYELIEGAVFLRKIVGAGEEGCCGS